MTMVGVFPLRTFCNYIMNKSWGLVIVYFSNTSSPTPPAPLLIQVAQQLNELLFQFLGAFTLGFDHRTQKSQSISVSHPYGMERNLKEPKQRCFFTPSEMLLLFSMSELGRDGKNSQAAVQLQ